MKKRIISLFLAAVMFIVALSGTVVADAAAEPDITYNRYHYTTLSDSEKALYAALESGVRNVEASVSVSEHNVTVDTVNKVMTLVANDYPEYFWFDGVFEASATDVTLTYNDLINDLDNNKKLFNEAVAAHLAAYGTEDGYLALLDLHDSFGLGALAYDFEYEYDNAYGVLVNKTSGDLGYNKAYAVIVNAHPDKNISAYCIPVSNSDSNLHVVCGILYTDNSVTCAVYTDVKSDISNETNIYHVYFNMSEESLQAVYTPEVFVTLPNYTSLGLDYWSMGIKSKYSNAGMYVLESLSQDTVFPREAFGLVDDRWMIELLVSDTISSQFWAWFRENHGSAISALKPTTSYSRGYMRVDSEWKVYIKNIELEDPITPQYAPKKPTASVTCDSIAVDRVINPNRGVTLYSIDGENWQESRTFDGLTEESYTVYVKFPAVADLYYESPITQSDPITLSVHSDLNEDHICDDCESVLLDNMSSVVATQESASIRISDTNSGLRFKTQIKTAILEELIAYYGAENVSVGTLIAPTDLLGGNKLTHAIGESGRAYIDVAAVISSPFEVKGDVSIYAGSIVNIKAGNLERDFTAVGYIKIVDGDEVIYIYSETSAERNINEIAIAAFSDVSDTVNENHKYLISSEDDIYKGKYSPYTKTQREKICAFIVNCCVGFAEDSYTWEYGGGACRAARICAYCGETLKEELAFRDALTVAVTEGDCASGGVLTRTATFSYEGFETQIKTEEFGAGEHVYRGDCATRCLSCGQLSKSGITVDDHEILGDTTNFSCDVCLDGSKLEGYAPDSDDSEFGEP